MKTEIAAEIGAIFNAPGRHEAEHLLSMMVRLLIQEVAFLVKCTCVWQPEAARSHMAVVVYLSLRSWPVEE
jgi:hypothetical protein